MEVIVVAGSQIIRDNADADGMTLSNGAFRRRLARDKALPLPEAIER